MLWIATDTDSHFCYVLSVPDLQGVVTVNRGDALMLPCHVSSSSSVTWLHLEKPSVSLFFMYSNGEVDFALQYRVNISNPAGGDYSLIHHNIQKDDAGRYMCCLENAACSGQMLQYIYTVYVNGLSAFAFKYLNYRCHLQ